jgi:excisionase family DNA binding protein
MDKLGLTVPEAAALSSLGQTSIYKAIREGRLRIRKYGTRTIITRSDLASLFGKSAGREIIWPPVPDERPELSGSIHRHHVVFRWPRREVGKCLHHDTPFS